MTEIAILYDRSETDELGIRYTAKQLGFQLTYLPFHKVALTIGGNGVRYRSQGKKYDELLSQTKVVINRTQAKHRRILAANIIESTGKEVLNPAEVEQVCQSKLTTLFKLWRNGIDIPKTTYIPCNVQEKGKHDSAVNNEKDVQTLITRELGSKVVLKPDQGTHGNDIELATDDATLLQSLRRIKPGVNNPAGVTAQELVPKWFYDLRIVIEKQCKAPIVCHPTAMARGGFKDFRTNTYRGNMVFRVKLPHRVREAAVRCGEALTGNTKSWVIALDAMPCFREEHMNSPDIEDRFSELEKTFTSVQKAKSAKTKDFQTYTESVEKAYKEYMDTEEYNDIQKTIHRSLRGPGTRVLFHEANACPDFWEQTRIVGGVNIASSLLRCAESLVNQ